MPDRLLLENGTDKLLMEDGSLLLLDTLTQDCVATGIASAEVVSGGGGGGGGGLPTVDAITTASAAASPVVGSLPAGTGDFLVAYVGVDNENPVTATGWTVQGFTGASAATPADSSITCLTAPSSVSSFSFAYSQDAARFSWCVIYRISGAAGVHAENQIPATVTYTNTTSTTRAIPQVTTTVDNCLVLSGVVGDSAAGANYTWPAGWSEDQDLNDSGTGMTVGTARSTQAVAGTTTGGNVTIVASGEHMSVITLALEPAAGGGGGGPVVTYPAPTMQPTAIASAEAIGTHTANVLSPGAQTLTATGISSQESFAGGGGVTPGLPGLVDGIEPEAQGGFVGPYYDSNGAMYRITEEYLGAPGPAPFGNHVMMMKSGDGGVTWSRMDATNGPGYGSTGAMNDLESAWMIQNAAAKQLYPIWCKAQGRWFSATYNTSDHPTAPDQWVTADNPVSAGIEQFSPTASESGIAGAITSTGVCHAFVRGIPQSTLEAFKWRKRASGTTTNAGWTDMGYITDSVGMSRPQAVVGESDKVYLFYRGVGGTVRYRTITTADVVSASAQISASAGASDSKYMNNCLPPVYYDAGGTPVVTVAYVNGSDQLKTNEVRGGSVTGEITVSTDTVVVDPLNNVGAGTDNQGPSAALVAIGTTLYAFWGTGQVIKYATKADGGSWSAATQYVDLGSGKEAQWIYANKFTRSGSTLIGLTYDKGPTADDDSDIYYNEFLVTGGGGTVVTVVPPVANMQPTAITSAEAFGTTAVTTKISLAPLAIASVEAFGTASLSAFPTMSPTGIASGEAFGSATALGKITSSPTAIASAEALGTPSVGAVVTLSPSGIATAEAMGSPNAGGVPTMGPTGIASSQAFGNPTLSMVVAISPTGIATAEAFGTATTLGKVTLSPTGLASAEAFGTTVVSQLGAVQNLTATAIASLEAFGTALLIDTRTISPTGIASAQAMGTPVVGGQISLSAQGIATSEAFGTPALSAAVLLTPTGLGSAESVGTPSVSGVISLTTVGIASAQAMGNPVLGMVITLSPPGISSAEAMGTPVLQAVTTMQPTGIASALAFGIPSLLNVNALTAVGIASAEAVGVPSLLAVIALAPTGIASAEGVGVPSALVHLDLAPTGIASAQAFGNPASVTAGTIAPTGISGAEAVGTPSVVQSIYLTAVAIASAEAVGTPSLVRYVSLSPVAVNSAEAVGSPSITTAVGLSPLGIGSAESLGTPTLAPTLSVFPVAIASAQALGTPGLSVGYTAAPAGVPSAEAMGTPSVTSKVNVVASGIGTVEAFGVPNLLGVNSLAPQGIASAQAMGTPSLASKTTMTPDGVASSEAFGLPSTLPKIGVSPTGIPSAAAVGNPTLRSVLTALAQGVPSQEAWGAPIVQLGAPVIYTPATEADAYFSYEDERNAQFGSQSGGASFDLGNQDTSLIRDNTTTTLEA